MSNYRSHLVVLQASLCPQADRFGNANITMVGNTTIGEYEVSQSPDYTSLLNVGGRLFSFVHFESPNPAVMYMVELRQNRDSCDLTAIR